MPASTAQKENVCLAPERQSSFRRGWSQNYSLFTQAGTFATTAGPFARAMVPDASLSRLLNNAAKLMATVRQKWRVQQIPQ
jgi:hypothetical protein